MPTFYVRHTFEIPERKLFVLAGLNVEGEIRTGMFIHIPFNSSAGMSVRIHRIEFARREGGEDLCLGVELEPGLEEILRGLNLGDETLDITTRESD